MSNPMDVLQSRAFERMARSLERHLLHGRVCGRWFPAWYSFFVQMCLGFFLASIKCICLRIRRISYLMVFRVLCMLLFVAWQTIENIINEGASLTLGLNSNIPNSQHTLKSLLDRVSSLADAAGKLLIDNPIGTTEDTVRPLAFYMPLILSPYSQPCSTTRCVRLSVHFTCVYHCHYLCAFCYKEEVHVLFTFVHSQPAKKAFVNAMGNFRSAACRLRVPKYVCCVLVHVQRWMMDWDLYTLVYRLILPSVLCGTNYISHDCSAMMRVNDITQSVLSALDTGKPPTEDDVSNTVRSVTYGSMFTHTFIHTRIHVRISISAKINR